MKRWKNCGIYNAVAKGINDLPYLDSFKDIGTLVENENLMSMITYDESSFDQRQHRLEKYEADSESEWEDNVGNIFERLNGGSKDNEP